jgi:protein TonB
MYKILEVTYSNGLITGKVVEYNGSRYGNDYVKRSYVYKNGKLDGPWTAYKAESYSIIEEGFFSDGKRYGEWRFYNGYGVVKGNYIDGMKSGVFEEYRNSNNDTSCYDCRVKTKPMRRNDYQNDQKEGLQELFYDNGTLKEVSEIRDGTVVSYENYNRFGEAISSLTYLNGKKSGSELTFYDDGQLKSSENWINGDKHNQWDFYDQYGNIQSTEIYDYGNLLEKHAYKNGNKISRTVYQNNNQRITYELDESENITNSKKYINDLLVEEKYYFTDPETNETFITEGKFRNNKMDGLWKFFDESGHLIMEGEYESGLANGKWSYYYEVGEESYIYDSLTTWEMMATFFPTSPTDSQPADTDEVNDMDTSMETESISEFDANMDVAADIGGFSTVDSEYLPIVKVAPIYPTRALLRGIEGYCIVEFVVTRIGTTINGKIIECTSSLFAKASLKAVEKFKYKPRVINGTPMDVPGVQHKISFVLER